MSDAISADGLSDSQPEPTPVKPSSSGIRTLRIWPVSGLLIVMWMVRLVPGLFDDVPFPVLMAQFMVPLLICLLLVIWWLALSRATISERLLGLLGLIAIVVGTTLLADKSVQGFGTMIFAIPWGMTAMGVAAILVSRLQTKLRTAIMLLVTLAVFGYWDLVRNDGIWGDFRTDLSWRWQPTDEDEFVRSLESRPKPSAEALEAAEQPVPTAPEWPAFRGDRRDGRQPGISLGEDWSANKPELVWKNPVGPGWSSFSVAGRRLFTQEQRDQNEVVVCYDAETGSELWSHQSEARFYEAVGGAGPRATPTLQDGMLYSLGATGLLVKLNPTDGSEVWQSDLRLDAQRDPPEWGFSSSPLVTDGVVVVHAGGAGELGLLAYGAESGDLKWSAPSGDHSYSSPQLGQFGDQTCILMLTNEGLDFVAPEDGTVLLSHSWKFEGYRVVQPLVLADSSVLLGTAMGPGTRRLSVDSSTWKEDVEWTSRFMKPYYNDYVEHQGFLYGFDNKIFACIDLESGKQQWKRGRYGNGQVLLLPDADQLLVVSESGELVLLRANPEKHEELTRFQVLDGKTWNHPVLIGDRLYVRNAKEAACFRMPLK